MTIVCTTNEGLFGKCRIYKPGLVLYEFTYESKSLEIEFELTVQSLSRIASEGVFESYIAGTLLAILAIPLFEQFLLSQGMHVHNYLTTLPMQKGLSSSAAVCVLIVKCFASVYNVEIDINKQMEIAYSGEMYTPSKCGRMDQCVAMGENQIGLMIFNNNSCRLRTMHCPSNMYYVVANLNSCKDTVKILTELSACFPLPTSDDQVTKIYRYTGDIHTRRN